MPEINSDNREDVLSAFAEMYDRAEFVSMHEEMSYGEYIRRVKENPKLCRNSFQYIYDMIMSAGTSTFVRYRKTHTKYHFFDDPEIPIFGLEETLESIVDFIHGNVAPRAEVV